MATAFISKFHRQFVISAAVHRQGSNHHHILGAGRFGFVPVTKLESGQNQKFTSDSNVKLISTNFGIQQQQKRSYLKRYNESQLLQKFDYDTYTESTTPSTVKGNVKNVAGWKGAVERGFNATYADCIHRISENVPTELVPWQTKVLTQNLSLSVLGQRFGILVPITYYQTMPTKPTREQMTLAHVLGWSVELLRAADIVTNDTIAITTNLENMNRRADDKQPEKNVHRHRLTWAAKNDIGNRAFNDSMTLEQGAQILIRHYFRDDPILMSCLLETVLESIRMTTLGRSLELSWKETSSKATRLQLPGGMNMSYYDLNKYKTRIRTKYTFIDYCLPVSLALHLANIHQPEVHIGARKILHQMGYISELYHDFVNCYADPEGKDIQDGKLTWLIVVACQRANAKQKAILHECYGAGETGPESEANVAAVKKVYKELNLQKTAQTNIENTRKEVMERIQGISKIDSLGLTPEFFFKLMDQMSLHDIS